MVVALMRSRYAGRLKPPASNYQARRRGLKEATGYHHPEGTRCRPSQEVAERLSATACGPNPERINPNLLSTIAAR